MYKPVDAWPEPLIEMFLEAWWNFNQGLYNEYHTKCDEFDISMIERLRHERPGTFDMIWDSMGYETIELLESYQEPPEPPKSPFPRRWKK